MESTTYEVPSIVELGSIEALTQANGSGGQTDASFPAHTKKGDLTFS